MENCSALAVYGISQVENCLLIGEHYPFNIKNNKVAMAGLEPTAI